jgi:hypothetical protein
MSHNTSDFASYETTTVDPGWEFTVAVVAICVLVNLSLPLWLRLGGWWNRLSFTRFHSEEHEEVEIQFTSNKHEEAPPKLNVSSGSLPVVNTSNINSKRNRTPPPPARTNVDAPSISVNSKTLIGHYDHFRSNNNNNGPSSIVSSSVASSSLMSDVASSIFGTRRKRSRLPLPHHKIHVRSPVTDSESPRRGVVRKAAEYATTEQAFHRYTAMYGDLTKDFHDHHQSIHVGRDDRSDHTPSILSKLDVDEISVQDAIDAKDSGVRPTVHVEDRAQNPSFGWVQFLEIADWDKEMRKYVALAVPICLQAVSVELFAIINVAIVGHIIGVREANAFVVVGILLELTTTLTRGFGECK